jgi:hypothetical protein
MLMHYVSQKSKLAKGHIENVPQTNLTSASLVQSLNEWNSSIFLVLCQNAKQRNAEFGING